MISGWTFLGIRSSRNVGALSFYMFSLMVCPKTHIGPMGPMGPMGSMGPNGTHGPHGSHETLGGGHIAPFKGIAVRVTVPIHPFKGSTGNIPELISVPFVGFLPYSWKFN